MRACLWQLESYLADEAFNGDEAFRGRVNGKEEAFQGHGPKEDGASRRDGARRGDILSVEDEAHLGDGPSLLPASSDLHGMGPEGYKPKAVGQVSGDDEESGSCVYQKVSHLVAPSRANQTSRNAEEAHHIALHSLSR